MSHNNAYSILTAEEAADHVFNGATVGFSGFTPAGAAKAIPRAIAAKAKALHEKNEPYQIRVLTGASTGKNLDETLAAADAVSWRAPYQSSRSMRKLMNQGKVQFIDMHLSHVPQTVAEGFFGNIDFAIVEATHVTSDGRVYLSSSIGASPTYLKCADKIIIEINRRHSPRVSEMADIAILPNPPYRSPIPIFHCLERIGWPYATIDPKKVIGIVETDEPDDVNPFAPADAVSNRLASNVVHFLCEEKASGRIPKQFLPLQSGVGNIANAVMAGLGESEDIPPFLMYSEVFQDALVDLMLNGKLVGASATSLTLSPERLKQVYDNMDFFVPRIVLRPQELSNNPGIVRRLGVITTNTALEVDIYGHANSTHVSGTQMMNGVGGSGDFTRNAYLSIFMCPSVAKGGRISTIVPMATHVDHNEHSVQVVITEQGIADLRGKGPIERAKTLIDNCAHPAYRPYLHKYLETSPMGHIRHDLRRCFEMHLNLAECGQMLPDLDLSVFADMCGGE
ncbi:MAG: propionyl-CoA:succinyl-CoA transferase [Candidatus Sumerlaeota bacterium]|nr:propionyl-CoA:succinyl-CoA transferase [Candidatus Sumerlaeota bacterium]